MKKLTKFVLKGKRVHKATLMEWANFLEIAGKKRVVKQSTIGKRWISTVFLGLDYSWTDKKRRIFETMIFKIKRGKADMGSGDLFARCATWGQAEKLHAKAINHARRLRKKS